MAEREFTRRQFIIGAGATGIVGAAGGFIAASLKKKPKYTYDLRIRGGYAWLFQEASGKASIRLLCLKSASCSDTSQFLDHEMNLYMQKSKVTEDTSSGNYHSTDGKKGRITWKLDGPTTFTKGMAANGVGKAPASNQGGLSDPYGPLDPIDDDLWNDMVWVAGSEKPKTNATSLASRYLDLTEGLLTVHRPESEQARGGRWKMKDAAGNPLKRALTDSFSLVWSSDDGISIQTAGGPIVFTPTGSTLVMHLAHELDPMHVDIQDGYKLEHFNMLYDFVDGKSCDSVGAAPEYEKRGDLSGMNTPGDFCPPLCLA